MLDQLALDCDACGRSLDAGHRQLAFATEAGERRAYECDCGAITVTVARPEADDRRA